MIICNNNTFLKKVKSAIKKNTSFLYVITLIKIKEFLDNGFVFISRIL